MENGKTELIVERTVDINKYSFWEYQFSVIPGKCDASWVKIKTKTASTGNMYQFLDICFMNFKSGELHFVCVIEGKISDFFNYFVILALYSK